MILPDWNLLVMNNPFSLRHTLYLKIKMCPKLFAKLMLLGNGCSDQGLRIGTGPTLDRRGYGC